MLSLAAGLCLCTLVGVAAPSPDIVVGDFDRSDFGGWIPSGSAFGSRPIAQSELGGIGISGAESGVASSKPAGDDATGRLSSPEFRIQRRYIAFSISGGDYEHNLCLNLLVGGQVVKSATGRNTDQMTPASWDVSAYAGKSARIEILDDAHIAWGHISVGRIIQTNSPERLPVVTQPPYTEALRPQVHFTARQWTTDRLDPQPRQEGWINDLNGLIYYDGEYHLFAQRWYKCWLHAVSRDLVHWTELRPAFWEEQIESGCQSGTCVIDYANTSGLSKDPKSPPMVAFWPRANNREQCIDYSLDHGRTWTRYAGNPVLEHPERDPKVFWYAPGRHWVMVLYGDGKYHILTSPNLLAWTDTRHPIPDSFECPDFFQLPVDGDKGHVKWVLMQGSGRYSVGDFDGVEFKEETARFPVDLGPNFYATQTWANTETGDGRIIQAAWMRGSDFPGMPFNQQTSFPCELTLHSTPAGLRVFRQPIPAIRSLYRRGRTWSALALDPAAPVELAVNGNVFHVEADLEVPDGAEVAFDIGGAQVVLSPTGLVNGDVRGSVQGRVRHVEIIVDRGSIEVFVNHGELSSTRFALPKAVGISVRATGSQVLLTHLSCVPLKSIWPSAKR